MRWRDSTFLSLDLETTGLDRARDGIVELGLAVFERGRCTGAEGHLCNPGIPIPKAASAIHGLEDTDVSDKPPPGLVLSLHLPLLTRYPLVGYNLLGFDLPLLQRELRARGVYFAPVAVDVLTFASWHLRDRERKLPTLCAHFGIALPRAHSAAADAKACGELALHLVGLGLIPDDVPQAAAESAELRRRLDLEHARYGRWLYADRQDPRVLRLGCGEQQGRALEEDVAAGFCRWALRKAGAELPAEVRALFSARADAHLQEAPAHA